jgi:AIPR protein
VEQRLGVREMATLRLIAPQNPTTLDFGVVEARIAAQSPFETERNRQFARYVCTDFFQISDSDIDNCITDGANDFGVDVIYIDYNNKIINICNLKTVSKYKNSLSNFPSSELDKIYTFLDVVMYRKEDVSEKANQKISSFIKLIWDLLENDNWKICIKLFSNQLTLVKSESERFLALITPFKGVTLEQHGLYQLVHGSVVSSRPRFRKKMPIEGGCAFEVRENGHRGLQTRISLSELAKFVATTGDIGKFDERLLHHNVRYFLGTENEVNKSIRDSLSTEDAHDFWFLNNGVTIVCDNIIGVCNGTHPVSLLNPQIVNGGQTSRVVHARFFAEMVKGPEGSIPLKIIETTDLEFINRIAVASNNQSRIYGRDLRANDSRQLKLAEALSKYGIFYRRKRGEKSNFVHSTEYDSFRTGQLLLTVLKREPVRAKTVSNELFGDLYEQAFDEVSLNPEFVIACHKLDSTVDSRKAKNVALHRIAANSKIDEPWIVEGHFHVMFVTAELIRRAGAVFENTVDFDPYVTDAVRIVENFVKRNIGTSGYRLFRSASSKIGLLELLEQDLPENDNKSKQLEIAFTLS